VKFTDRYPKDRIYAADFKGKAVTLTFAEPAVTTDVLGEGGPGAKSMPVWHFVETPKKMPAVLTNVVCAKAMFGDDDDEWAGHKITLYPEKDTSGMAEDGLCIRVKGSPELDKPLKFRTQIGRTKQTFTLVPTPARSQSASSSNIAVEGQEGASGASTASDPNTGLFAGDVKND
jgi:hypothetical protein